MLLLGAGCAPAHTASSAPPASAAAAAPAERAEANAALVRRFWEAWHRQDWAALDAMVAPGFRHNYYQTAANREGFRAGSRALLAAFPDWRVTLEDVVAQGDRVAVRATARGTHRGEYYGIAASGRSIVATVTFFYRIVDGRIAEDWETGDYCSLFLALQPADQAGPDVRQMCAEISGL